MKRIAFLLLCFSLVLSCNPGQKKGEASDAQQEDQQLIGGEKDEQGCVAAAGETWSELLQACVRIIDEGIRLNPIEREEGEAVISIFALFDKDKTKVEIFLSNEDATTIILDKTENGLYQNELLSFNSEENALYIGDILIYKAE